MEFSNSLKQDHWNYDKLGVAQSSDKIDLATILNRITETMINWEKHSLLIELSLTTVLNITETEI